MTKLWPARPALLVFAFLCGCTSLADTAAAQGFLSFLWGGGSREVVPFHAHSPAGTDHRQFRR